MWEREGHLPSYGPYRMRKHNCPPPPPSTKFEMHHWHGICWQSIHSKPTHANTLIAFTLSGSIALRTVDEDSKKEIAAAVAMLHPRDFIWAHSYHRTSSQQSLPYSTHRLYYCHNEQWRNNSHALVVGKLESHEGYVCIANTNQVMG